MKRFFVVILIFILVTPFLIKSSIYFDYFISYDTIVNELCENKDKPEMQCNGKCYMNKQLAIVDGVNIDEERIPNSNHSTPEKVDTTLIFILSSLFFCVSDQDQREDSKFDNLTNFYHFLFEYEYFTPPKIQNI